MIADVMHPGLITIINKGAKYGLPVCASFPEVYVYDVLLMEFEGKSYPGMRAYDDVLTCWCGDYMQFPPIEKRITHSFKAWWK